MRLSILAGLQINLDMPRSGILASSLINDKGHDKWLEKWVEITSRGLTDQIMKKSLFIGISSSGKSENVVSALNYASDIGANSLITASDIKTKKILILNSAILKLMNTIVQKYLPFTYISINSLRRI